VKKAGAMVLLVLLVARLTLGNPGLTFGTGAAVTGNPYLARVSISVVGRQVWLANFLMKNANNTPGRALILPAQGPTLGITSYHANDIMGEYGLPVIAGTYMPSSNGRVSLSPPP